MEGAMMVNFPLGPLKAFAQYLSLAGLLFSHQPTENVTAVLRFPLTC
jgi:hypothetical protein